MSWFDTAGLASLAKNALKEAQKHIDKALDIQDEEMNSTITKTVTPTAAATTTTKTTTTPPMPYTDSTWGSFTGSFFDNPKSDEMVTTPPKSASTPSTELLSPLLSPTTAAAANLNKRESINSNSDSVELILSPPTSPSITVFNSESVEVINTPTPNTFSPTDISCDEFASSPTDSKAKSSDSVEIIDHEEILEEDEDSMSFNTVMDEEIPSNSSKILTDSTKTLKQMQSIDQSLSASDTIDSSCSQSKLQNSIKSVISLEENFLDSQTVLSDSTQSFENVQILDTAEQSSLHSDEKASGGQSVGNGSGHASADEIETTTSSDIEIISNPNGDSSSTNSACRITPVKYQHRMKNYANGSGDQSFRSIKKGHCREPSEISIQSEDSQSESEKLLRRIIELNEILENRELKLVELSRQNAMLVEKNAELSQLEANRKNDDSEEHTQRLSALEKKFQASIRERDALREQLSTIRNELSSKIPKDDLNKIIAEKDFMIEELKIEGEKLSKNVLQHSNIIKKLRAKEKESDSNLKRNKEQIESLTDEVERLKKSLTAKEEVERTQIEAINKLSSAKRKLEKENETQKSQIEDLTSKIETLRTSLDAAKKELVDRHQSQREMSRKQEALATIEAEHKSIQSQNTELITKLEEMREKLKISEKEQSFKEQKLRQDNVELMARLEKSEQRCEELTNEVSLATVPLVRQLEALQSTLTNRTNSWEKHEEKLVKELNETRETLENLKHIETQSKLMESTLNNRIKNLEDQLQNALLKYEQANSELQQNMVNFNLKDSIQTKKISELELKLEESKQLVNEFKVKSQKLEEQQNSQSMVVINTAGQNENINLIRGPGDTALNMTGSVVSGVSDSNTIEDELKQGDRNQSPTFSVERNSMSESVNSAWQMDDLDVISNSGRRGIGSLYDFGLSGTSLGGIGPQILNSTAMLENLQATLKQKDGELSQLQWENSRIKSERNVLNSEISNITLELENLKERMSGLDTLEKDFMELKHQYDALLQMYGEKVEEAQELELDLQDVKEMYKAQIDELLRQQKEFLSSSK